MSLYSVISTALKPLNIPTRRLRLSSTDESKNYDQYIIVYFLNEYGVLFGDDEEIATAHSIQISLFTRLDFEQTVKEIKKLLKPLGFMRTSEYENYEYETGYYHKVIRFSYANETEE